MHVDGHRRIGDSLERHGIRSRREYTALTQPAGACNRGAWTAHLRDELFRIAEISRPSRADQNDIAPADLDVSGAREVVGRDGVVLRQWIGARDVQQYAAADDRGDHI